MFDPEKRFRIGGATAAVRPFVLLLIGMASASLALLLGGQIPHRLENIEKRMLYLMEHPESYDVIFVGSSRIRFGVSVRRFDAVLRSRGIEMKPSFNLGTPEAFMHQNFYTVRRLLESGVRPRYLFIEASCFTSELRSPRMKRFEVWHDREETLRVLKTTYLEKDVPKSYGNRMERAWMHLRYFLRKNLHLGRVLQFTSAPQPPPHERALFEATRGYARLPKVHDLDDPGSRRYFEKPALWDERLAELKAAYEDDYARPINVEAFRDLIAYVDRKGVELVFVGTPYSVIDWVEPLLWMEREGLVSKDRKDGKAPLFLNFNLPTLPYVRDLELRLDEDHVNNEGATLWAEDLAEAFADSLIGRQKGDEGSNSAE